MRDKDCAVLWRRRFLMKENSRFFGRRLFKSIATPPARGSLFFHYINEAPKNERDDRLRVLKIIADAGELTPKSKLVFENFDYLTCFPMGLPDLGHVTVKNCPSLVSLNIKAKFSFTQGCPKLDFFRESRGLSSDCDFVVNPYGPFGYELRGFYSDCGR